MRKKINLPTVFNGQRVGLKEVDDAIWLVTFMTYDLGYADLEARTLQPLDNPFGTRLLPVSQVQTVTHVFGLYNDLFGRGRGRARCRPGG